MISSMLVQAVLDGVIGGGRKRSSRARRYLTGSRGSLWTNPSVLMTAAGLAWGVVESLQQTAGQASPASPTSQPPSPASSHAAAPATAASLPPLPDGSQSVDDAGLRLLRLAVSAANADGTISDQEQAAIVQRVRADGHAEVAETELRHPRPVAEIVAGVTDRAEAATLYVLAFTILRADEQVTPSERIYLAQLAHLLGLDRATVAMLEQDTGDRIDALGDQGQLGG